MNSDILNIENKIQGVIVRWNMLPPGCTVVVGLSGGADSLTLAHFLLKYGKPRHIRLIAAHINHGLRGEEADGDERFVSRWCGENGVELKLLHADVRALAAEKSEGLEECGRNVRYGFFKELAGENGKIATAHTLSDSTETVLMNLTKGAGTRGLRGIPPVRGNIVRPLIGITRAEVEAYCAHYGLHYVTDSTNFEAEYERNKIRLGVIPVLREINPAFESAVFGMTGRLSEDDEYLNKLAHERLEAAACPGGYRLETLRELPGPLLSRAIAMGVERVRRVRLESRHIEAVAEIVREGTGSATVAGRIQCTAQGNTLSIAAGSDPASFGEWSVPFIAPKTVLPDGRTLTVVKLTEKELEKCHKFNKLLFNNLINYDTISSTTSVRNRRNGDTFRPAGRGVTKSLKKLFNEGAVAPSQRGKIVMLESGGEIIWIEGFGVSQRACVTGDTHNIAEIIIKEFET